MWDLETIRYLNERSLLGTMKIVNDGIDEPGVLNTKPTPEPVFPLAILAYKLITGPPSLIRLIDLLENSDSVAYFLELVKNYLPRHEVEIMAQTDDSGRIERFCHYFGNQYFPLQDVGGYYDDFTISDFAHDIPVELMGFSWDDYEEFNQFRDGFILLLSLVETPYDENERVPLLERVKELAGKGLMELIPHEGWTLEHIHRMFDGSEYEGVSAFADWIHSSTGCWQLDANYQDYAPEDWSLAVVDGLTEQWPTVVDLQDKMHKMFEWLEEDLYHNFDKLLAMMRGVEYETIPKEQIPFPLDEEGQVIRKEVIAVER